MLFSFFLLRCKQNMGDLNDSDQRLETITLFKLSDYANGLVQKEKEKFLEQLASEQWLSIHFTWANVANNFKSVGNIPAKNISYAVHLPDFKKKSRHTHPTKCPESYECFQHF